eukprot:scaffold161830_cov40-Tisochrysis_lutea.AAC.2
MLSSRADQPALAEGWALSLITGFISSLQATHGGSWLVHRRMSFAYSGRRLWGAHAPSQPHFYRPPASLGPRNINRCARKRLSLHKWARHDGRACTTALNATGDDEEGGGSYNASNKQLNERASGFGAACRNCLRTCVNRVCDVQLHGNILGAFYERTQTVVERREACHGEDVRGQNLRQQNIGAKQADEEQASFPGKSTVNGNEKSHVPNPIPNAIMEKVTPKNKLKRQTRVKTHENHYCPRGITKDPRKSVLKRLGQHVTNTWHGIQERDCGQQ